MGNDEQGDEMFAHYGLDDVPRVSDPDANLYHAFGLGRASLSQVLGPKVWRRGFESFFKGGHRAGPMIGDALQMPGVFLIQRGRILQGFIHNTSADRPDYLAMAAGEYTAGRD